MARLKNFLRTFDVCGLKSLQNKSNGDFESKPTITLIRMLHLQADDQVDDKADNRLIIATKWLRERNAHTDRFRTSSEASFGTCCFVKLIQSGDSVAISSDLWLALGDSGIR